MHIFSYLTEVSTNEVFKLRQAMKQDDRLDFVASMKMIYGNTRNVTTDYSKALIFVK